jgi:hypothetical protein
MSKALKTEYIQVKVSPEDKVKLQKLADEHGLTVSAYLRMVIVKEFKKLNLK